MSCICLLQLYQYCKNIPTVTTVLLHMGFVSVLRTNLFCPNIFDIFAPPYYNTYYMPHQGEILQEAIKNSGISITRIVEELGVTRPTIYRKFKEETIDYSFVKKVGDIIGHDFSEDFTSLQQAALPFVTSAPRVPVTNTAVTRVTSVQSADSDPTKQLLTLQTKYIALLEAYNELLLKVYGPK
jgi:hypothetical protein